MNKSCCHCSHVWNKFSLKENSKFLPTHKLTTKREGDCLSGHIPRISNPNLSFHHVSIICKYPCVTTSDLLIHCWLRLPLTMKYNGSPFDISNQYSNQLLLSCPCVIWNLLFSSAIRVTDSVNGFKMITLVPHLH